MTENEAMKVMLDAFNNTIENSKSTNELRQLKKVLLSMQRQAAIKYLVDNYSVQQLRDMGYNI